VAGEVSDSVVVVFKGVVALPMGKGAVTLPAGKATVGASNKPRDQYAGLHVGQRHCDVWWKVGGEK
jgi:hypothetical protein